MADLVTGGAGFVGSFLTQSLIESGREVIIFDIKPPAEDLEGSRYVRGDLTAWTDVMSVVAHNDIENVYHIGAMLSSASEKNPQAAFRTNLVGTFNVLEAIRLFDVDKCLFSSTIGVYGSDIQKATEKSVQRPTVSMYGTCKVGAERIGEYYHEKYDLDFRGVRLSTVLGPGQGTGATSAYASLMIQNPAEGNPYEVYVREDTTESVIYVRDAVRGLIELGQTDEDNLTERIYNLGGISTTARELANAVEEEVPEAQITFEPDPEAQAVRDMVPDVIENSLAQSDWNWQLKYDDPQIIVKEFLKDLRSD